METEVEWRCIMSLLSERYADKFKSLMLKTLVVIPQLVSLQIPVKTAQKFINKN